MEKIKFLIVMSVCLIFISCEKDIRNGLLPGYEPKLVVTSFISPSDNLSFIGVASNRPVHGELLPYPDPGEISGWISDGESEIKMDAADGGLVFSKDEMLIVNGKTYNIRIINNKGLKATARCTIPGKFDHSIAVDTFSVIRENVDPSGYVNRYRDLTISVRFKDQPRKVNYYRMLGKYITFFTYHDNDNGDVITIHNDKMYFNKDLFTDSESDEKGEIEVTPWTNSYYYDADSVLMKIYVLDTEESYYLWHKTILDYKDDENPFTEPTPVFTNIEGGLGVFTSYSMDSVVFRMK
ncbi:MAG: DUF4249 domain-containing protein [Bacteroidales bacterium]